MNDKETYLYIIGCGDFWKVGYSGNMSHRLSAMYTHNPYKVSLLHTFSMQNKEFARRAEKIAHGLLKDAGLHFRNEWFHNADDQEIIRICQEAVAIAQDIPLKEIIKQRRKSRGYRVLNVLLHIARVEQNTPIKELSRQRRHAEHALPSLKIDAVQRYLNLERRDAVDLSKGRKTLDDSQVFQLYAALKGEKK